MAQPGEARVAVHTQVATIQRGIVGVAIGCMTIGFIALLVAAYQWHELQHAHFWLFIGVGCLFEGLGWLASYVGRGLLMLRWPRDVEGQLQSARERTGRPRLYGAAMIWCGLTFVAAWWLMEAHFYQVFRDLTSIQDDSGLYGAVFGLLAASMVPMLLIEAYGWWWREHKREVRH